MPMTLPMLADFAIRLACGLAAMLLATSWRSVPPAFFRTQCQVVLGLLVLAALDERWHSADRLPMAVTVGAAALGYLASVAWGLGLPRVGLPLTAALFSASAALLVMASRDPSPGLWALGAAGRLASAGLLGSTLTAMLLGHHYLTAPSMSIDPLRRYVRAMAMALVGRASVAAIALGLLLGGILPSTSGADSVLFLGMRWVMGLIGPALAAYLTWRTVLIRSTQSATGILYAAMTLVLTGELSALILARGAGAAL